MTKRKVVFIFAISLIILTFFGWCLEDVSRFPPLKKILIPKYPVMVSTSRSMKQESFILTEVDKGFSEMAQLLKCSIKTVNLEEGSYFTDNVEYLRNTNDWEIWKIQTLKSGFIIGHNGKIVPALELQICTTSNKVPEIVLDFEDLEKIINRVYKQGKLSFWGGIIFWIGFIATILTAIIGYVDKKNNSN
jgi:hypothetical protein